MPPTFEPDVLTMRFMKTLGSMTQAAHRGYPTIALLVKDRLPPMKVYAAPLRVLLAKGLGATPSAPIPNGFGIELGRETIRILRGTACAMLARPGRFNAIGEPSLEQDGEQMPRCPERKRYAELLAETAVVAIVMHEAAHILYGHVALKAAANKEGDPLSAVDEQTLEYFADYYGTVHLVAHVLEVEYPDDREFALRLLIAASVLPHLLSDSMWAPPNSIGGHPMPQARVGAKLTAIAQMAQKLGVGATIGDLLDEVLPDVLRAFTEVLDRPVTEEMVGLFLAELNDGFRQYGQHWNQSVRERLEPHSCFELAVLSVANVPR